MMSKDLEERIRAEDSKWEDLWNRVLGKYSEFAWKRSQHIYDSTGEDVQATKKAIKDVSDKVTPQSVRVDIQEAYDTFYDRFEHYYNNAGVERNTALVKASEDVTAYMFTARKDFQLSEDG